MSLSPDALIPALNPWRHAGRWYLGLSGGLDSTVLLHLLVQLREQQPLPPLTAIHVDHQLSPSSPRWSAHCEALCEKLGVELLCRQVAVAEDGGGLEAAARHARYRVFEELLGEGDLLLLAHHLDDQVETFFLRLLRGAGTRGLGGMPAQRPLARGRLLRPLLQWRREELETYARDRQLDWVEDESNRDSALDRNYLRRDVLPLLEARWPGYRASVVHSMDAAQEAELDLRQRYQALLRDMETRVFGEPALDLGRLDPLGHTALWRLLRLWLSGLGLAAPGRHQLDEFVRQLGAAEGGASPQLDTEHYSLQVYRDCLHLRDPLRTPPPGDGLALRPGEALELPGVGLLEMRPVASGGLRLPPAGEWTLRFRSAGERCRPVGRGRSQTLKKLLQEFGVPPWWRDRLPLLYAGDTLCAAADTWICEGQQAAPGEQGFGLCWRRKTPLPPD